MVPRLDPGPILDATAGKYGSRWPSVNDGCIASKLVLEREAVLVAAATKRSGVSTSLAYLCNYGGLAA